MLILILDVSSYKANSFKSKHIHVIYHNHKSNLESSFSTFLWFSVNILLISHPVNILLISHLVNMLLISQPVKPKKYETNY